MGKHTIDEMSCGTSQNNPCSDLIEIMNKAEDGDRIMVDGNGTDDDPMIVCSEHCITKSLTIVGYNGQPKLTCNKTGKDASILMFTSPIYVNMYHYYQLHYSSQNTSGIQQITDHIRSHTVKINQRFGIDVVNFVSLCFQNAISLEECYELFNESQHILVQIENLGFTKGFLLAFDITVALHTCSLHDASIHLTAMQDISDYGDITFDTGISKQTCKSMNISLKNIHFSSHLLTDNPLLHIISSSCSSVSFSISNSVIEGQTILIVPGLKGGFVKFHDVLFQSSSPINRYGGVDIDNKGLKTISRFTFQVDIINCTFRDIFPEDGVLPVMLQYLNVSYAAIYIATNGYSQVNIQNSIFIGNERAIGIDKDKVNLTITKCLFINNTSMFSGAVIEIGDCCKDFSINISYSTFTANRAGYYGHISIFDGCLVYSEQSSLIGVQYVRNCTWRQTARQFELKYDSISRIVTVQRTFLTTKHIVVTGDGTILNARVKILGNDNIVKPNIFLYQSTFLKNEAGQGGVFYFEGHKVSVINCNFMYNVAKHSGGVIHSRNSLVEIVLSNFTHNMAHTGSAIYCLGSKQKILIRYSIISQNTAKSSGGGLWLQGGQLKIEGCTLTDNTAYGGGGFYLESVSTLLSNSTIKRNWVRMRGGGLYVWHGKLEIKWCSLIGNTVSTDRGGGLYLKDVTIVKILYSILESNEVGGSGGGLYMLNGELSVKWCNVSGV